MKKILICLLTLCMGLTLTACGEDKDTNNSNTLPSNDETNFIPNYPGGNMDYSNIGYVEGSIHQYNISELDDYVIENSQTQYKILIPSEASVSLVSYVSEFVSLFKEATNIELEVVTDDTFDSSAKYLSVGNTKLFSDSEIEMNYDQLKSQGFMIRTYNNSILFNGFTDAACLNGLYQYLTLIADYRYLGPETYILNKNLSDVKLFDYDILDAPDIEYRVSSYSFVTSGRKYRLTDAPFIPVNGLNYHNTFAYLPPEQYKSTYPEWYSIDGTQLCYTARGNKESLKVMQEHVVDVIKSHLIQFPDKNAITFTIQDSNTFCNCDTCAESYKKYNGSNAAVVVQFLNVVSDMVNEWFEGAGAQYKRDLKILFFAYLSTNVAPTKFDSTLNKYVPIDDSVVCRPNVCPFFADIRGDYTKSYYDQTSANKQYAESMKAWVECSSYLYFWTYSTNFHYYLTPYNSFDAMLDSYKFAVETNTNYIYDQAQFNQGQSSTGWSFLKQYMTSRATWDCNVEAKDLYDEFFSEFYSKEAGPIMRELFDEYRVLANYQTTSLGYSGPNSIYHNPFQSKYWSKQTLLRWIARFDEALEAIEVYKESSPGQYAKYYGHITSERVQYTYLLLKIYSASMSEDELVYYKAQFHSDAEGNGMLYESELANSLVVNILK